MKEIKPLKLQKYREDAYAEIAFEIYHNKKQNNYCFCFEADDMENDEYLLEDLLDQYSLSCTEYYGQEVNIGSETKHIAEVETLSDDKECLLQILNFSTIAGKEIISYAEGMYDCFGVKYADSNFSVNGTKIHVPIAGERNDRSGMISFETIYPEKQLEHMLTSGNDYQINLGEINVKDVSVICLHDGQAALIINYEDDTVKKIIFDSNGFVCINSDSPDDTLS